MNLLEEAARRLCECRSVDPEQIVDLPGDALGVTTSPARYGPAWCAAMAEILRFEQIQKALLHVRTTQ